MILLFTSFSSESRTEVIVRVPEKLLIKETLHVIYPALPADTPKEWIQPPFLGTSVIGFREALAFKESSGDYFITNTLGYLGKYQFGIGTLQLMGVYNATKFLKNPALQERVFVIIGVLRFIAYVIPIRTCSPSPQIHFVSSKSYCCFLFVFLLETFFYCYHLWLFSIFLIWSMLRSFLIWLVYLEPGLTLL